MRIAAVGILACLAVHGEIIDRIAITVNNRVITGSMIRQQIRLAAFQDARQPAFDSASLRNAAGTLVDQTLLIQEMDDARYPEPPMSDILEQLKEIIGERFKTEDAYRQALVNSGIDDQDFRRFLQQQQRAYNFIDVRFRTGVQASTEEIAAYYEKTFTPDWQRRNPARPVPTLDDVSADIEEIIIGGRVDAATAEWVKQARALTSIRFREEAFQQ